MDYGAARPNLMTVGTKNYIYDYDYEKDVITLYAIEHSEGNLMQVRKVQNIKVFPNPVSAGQTLHFQLPEGSITGVNILRLWPLT